MKVLDNRASMAHIGLAHGPGILRFIESNPEVIDYVELPFEQLRHAPDLASVQDAIPVILHCASMSVAGFVAPSDVTVNAIRLEAERTQTPWIGEHLAFVSADGINEEVDRDTSPTNLTYTICPQLSEETVDRVTENLVSLRSRFPVPIILENSPQYFAIPGSTMKMVEFMSMVVSRCDVGLLLDLSHFLITSLNMGVDATREICRLPLERVVEIHISGLNAQAGIVWDDHAEPAPSIIFELLERVLERAHPRAVTLEYNWSALPPGVLLSHVSKTRNILAHS